MEISTRIGVNVTSTAGVFDSTAKYINTPNRLFEKGDILQNEDKIYERSGNDFTPPDYNVSDDYPIDAIVYKDSKIQFVEAPVGTTIIKQPGGYTTLSTSMDFDNWSTRYTEIGDIANNTWSKDVNGIIHRLYLQAGIWRYSLIKKASETYWSKEEYTHNTPRRFIKWNPHFDEIIIQYGTFNDTIALQPIAPTERVSTYLASDGNTYRVGVIVSDGRIKEYSVSVQLTRDMSVVIYDEPVSLYTTCRDGHFEEKAICVNQSNCSDIWAAKTIIRRSDRLFVRTNTDDPVETRVLTDPLFAELITLDQANGWGWTYIKPSNIYAPFDDKKYTYTISAMEVEYTIMGVPKVNEGYFRSNNLFNTIAINGLIAGAVEITFLPDDGTAAIPMITIEPKTHRDILLSLCPAPTTIIVYAPRNITGSVHIKVLKLNAYDIRIGGIHLGQSVNAGFTNLTFTNKFKDYSPYEQDQWGNVTYSSGVKTNIYNGTVDVPIIDYDMINRLMMSVGGETVILNGSDTIDNSQIDDVNFFAATMVVGRIRNFELRTKLDNKRIHQMATYSFEIEEGI